MISRDTYSTYSSATGTGTGIDGRRGGRAIDWTVKILDDYLDATITGSQAADWLPNNEAPGINSSSLCYFKLCARSLR